MNLLTLSNIKHPYFISLLLLFLYHLLALLSLRLNIFIIHILITVLALIVPALSAFISSYRCKNKLYTLSLLLINPLIASSFYTLISIRGYAGDIPGVQGFIIIFLGIFIFYTLLPVLLGHCLANKIKARKTQ